MSSARPAGHGRGGRGCSKICGVGFVAAARAHQNLRCSCVVGNERIEGSGGYARYSIRRMAAVSDRIAFSCIAYAAIPAGVTNFEIEIWSGERKLYESVRDIGHLSRARELPEDVLATARYGHSIHDAALCLHYYGLSEHVGHGADIVQFAESLIAEG